MHLPSRLRLYFAHRRATTSRMITTNMIQPKFDAPCIKRLEHRHPIPSSTPLALSRDLFRSRMQQNCCPYSPQQYFASYGNPFSGQRNCPNTVPFRSSLLVHVSPTTRQRVPTFSFLIGVTYRHSLDHSDLCPNGTSPTWIASENTLPHRPLLPSQSSSPCP